jgi:hypothetical protein
VASRPEATIGHDIVVFGDEVLEIESYRLRLHGVSFVEGSPALLLFTVAEDNGDVTNIVEKLIPLPAWKEAVAKDVVAALLGKGGEPSPALSPRGT